MTRCGTSPFSSNITSGRIIKPSYGRFQCAVRATANASIYRSDWFGYCLFCCLFWVGLNYFYYYNYYLFVLIFLFASFLLLHGHNINIYLWWNLNSNNVHHKRWLFCLYHRIFGILILCVCACVCMRMRLNHSILFIASLIFFCCYLSFSLGFEWAKLKHLNSSSFRVKFSIHKSHSYPAKIFFFCRQTQLWLSPYRLIISAK